MASKDDVPAKTSKQLLYPEKFGGLLLERKLQIVGKKAGLIKPTLPPPSSVLSRVKELIPKLAAANEELRNKPPEEVSIENISSDYDGPVIKLDMALVPDMEDSESDEDSDEDSDDSSDEDSSEDSSEDSDTSKDSDEESEAEGKLIIPPSNQRTGTKRKFVLEVLDDEEKTEGASSAKAAKK